MTDKISIIIPVYNVEGYLSRCIDSVIRQTYQNIEILLIDDGSKDRSGEICDQYAAKDIRIKVIHKSNGGLSSARNEGIKNATGSLIAFIDSDDYISQYMFEYLHSMIVKYNVEVAFCDINITAEDTKVNEEDLILIENLRCFKWSQDEFWANWLLGDRMKFVVAWNKLYKRRIFDHVRFSEGKLHEDEFILPQIVDQCSSLVYCPIAMYNYIQREQSIMHTGKDIRHIDGVEAFCLRTKYFLSKGKLELAAFALVIAIGLLMSLKCQLDLKNLKTQNRYDEYKKECRKLVFQIWNAKMKVKDRIRLLAFLLGDDVYVFLKRFFDRI